MVHSSLLLLFHLLFHFSNASHFQIQGHRHAPRSLDRCGSMNSSLTLKNNNDILYLTNLTLGGDDFSVVIDTGSSDLWVSPPANGTVRNSADTGHHTSILYVSGSASGPIRVADMTFAGFQVKNQSFLEVPADKNVVGTPGVIGLGPSSDSNIQTELDSAVGYGPLDRIFLEDLTIPTYITFLLGRSLDITDDFPGDMTVGSVLEGYEAVLQEPRVPLDPDVKHYQFLLDEDSIIALNGQVVPVTSVVNTTSNPKQATALLDTGFSLSQVPKHVADVFYSGYDGAEYMNVTGVGNTWTVPCETEVNITFNIAGKTIPIHPLDATLNPELLLLSDGLNNSQGVSACIGSFQPISFDADATFDLLFGMSFVRNVYTLINYGDFVPGENTMTRGPPFVQFLPTTDPTEAHSDFVAVRKSNTDNSTSSVDGVLNAAALVSHSERSTAKDAAGVVSNTSKIANGLIPGISVRAVVTVCLIALIIFLVHRRNKKQKMAKMSNKETPDSDQQPFVHSHEEEYIHAPQVPPSYPQGEGYAPTLGQV